MLKVELLYNYFSISGRHHGGYDRGGDRHPDEDEGFDEHYFRRRPKSVCMSNDGRRFIPPTYGGLPPSAPSSHLPPQALGIEQQYTTTSSEEQHQRPPMTMVSIHDQFQIMYNFLGSIFVKYFLWGI